MQYCIMNRKVLILAVFVFLFAMAAVSASENSTVADDIVASPQTEEALSNAQSEALEKSYFYDASTGKTYKDDTVITHNVVKYYGDKDTQFVVKVYDKNNYPEDGVYVSFEKFGGKTREKTTNANGIIKFPINYKPGKYDVQTRIDCDDGQSYYYADNTVTIKSTIPTNELVKYSSDKSKFKIKFLDTKGNVLKKTKVSIKINGKKYKIATDNKGIVKISSKFKVGKHKITAFNPNSGEYKKISVVVLKKGIHKVNVKVDGKSKVFPTKKLKNGDYINTHYTTKYRQFDPGAYAWANGGGLENPKHTKLIKAKFYFKNKSTGKIITKTTKVKYHTFVVKPISGYSPYKVSVWYKDKV